MDLVIHFAATSLLSQYIEETKVTFMISNATPLLETQKFQPVKDSQFSVLSSIIIATKVSLHHNT